MQNFKFNKLDLFLSNSDYWDFSLNNDKVEKKCTPCIVSGDTLISEFDFSKGYSNVNIDTIFSTKTWGGAINNGINIPTYGLTGLDNGVLKYNKNDGDFSNENLVSILTGSTLTINSGDTRLFLNKVSGSTGNYIYPIEHLNDSIILKGGFYQGFYKLNGYDYDVLPNRYNNGFVLDFILEKNDNVLSGNSGIILNDTYPNNKGIFFYLGTRSENKFWSKFSGNSESCNSGSTEFCTNIKESDIFILNNKNRHLPLNPPRVIFNEINNEFLLYGRANKLANSQDKLGTLLACNVTGKTPTFTITSNTQTITNTLNPFLIYGRTNGNNCSKRISDGYGRETVCSYSGNSIDEIEINKDLDIIDNALAFIIKDDGSIGYRLMTVSASCIDNKTIKNTNIKEEFSYSGVVKPNKLEHISIRYSSNYYDECQIKNNKQRFGKLMFYVGCKLKFVVNNFPEFIGKRLDEYKEKQVGVPFSISLGGGTQGLLESMTFDGQDEKDLNLKIEQNFAGSFIGKLNSFKIYNENLNYCQLSELCKISGINECYLVDELGNYILQENNIDRIIVDC